MSSMSGDIIESWGPSQRDQRLRELIESRLMLLRVGHTAMLRVLQGNEKLRDGLPDDVRVISVHYDPQYRAFTMTLQSSSFKPVPDRGLIPVMEPEWLVTEKSTAPEIHG